MSVHLGVPLEEMDALARSADDILESGSFCTFFTATEVLEKIRQARMLPDIVKGLFLSVIKRVLEMNSFTERIVMTGGVVANNPYLVSMIEEITQTQILIPEFSQLTGAVDAVLFAAGA